MVWKGALSPPTITQGAANPTLSRRTTIVYIAIFGRVAIAFIQ